MSLEQPAGNWQSDHHRGRMSQQHGKAARVTASLTESANVVHTIPVLHCNRQLYTDQAACHITGHS